MTPKQDLETKFQEDCSQPGSSVHGIIQARILEWVTMRSSRDLPDPGIEHPSVCLLHWEWLPPGDDGRMSLTMAHWKHQSARSSLLDHRVRPGPEPESNWPWSSTCPLDWSWRPCGPRAHCLPRRAPPMGTSAQTRVNNTSEEEEYDEGMPKEEEGITYYIHYCPEDNSYQQGTDCSRQGYLAHLEMPPGDG